MSKIKALFLHRFSTLNAATRYRAHQYRPYLEDAGVDCEFDYFFCDSYIEYRSTKRPRLQDFLRQPPRIAASLARRWWLLLTKARDYDVVFVQYEALPHMPFLFEKGLYGPYPRVVVDFDDAVTLGYERHPNPVLRRLLRSKIPAIVAGSSHVIAANNHLARWAMEYNPNVSMIPNSIDLAKYPPRRQPRAAGGPTVVVWIGTPITLPYLKDIEGPLRELSVRHDVLLKVIGAPGVSIDGVKVVSLPWSESSEVEELGSAHFGIMPLRDDDWSRGKSALKLIQYLAAGITAVASPVGANCDVIEEGQNGLFAVSPGDWVKKMSWLIENPDWREQLARAGRETIAREYSLQRNAPRFLEVVRGVAGAGRPGARLASTVH